jgi:group I intron endonuclease
MKILIYEAKNKINSKCYYGQTALSLLERKISHLKECNVPRLRHLPFKRALIKYTINGFEWSVVMECDTQEDADKWETYFIDKNGHYNVASGGIGGRIELTPNQEKQRVSKILNTKSSWSSEHKAEIYSFTQTDKFKEDARSRMLGSKNHQFGKIGYWAGKKNIEHSKRMKGRRRGPMSEETKKKLSVAHKGKNTEKKKFYTLKHKHDNTEKTLSAKEWAMLGVDIGHLHRNKGTTNKGGLRASKGWQLINHQVN